MPACLNVHKLDPIQLNAGLDLHYETASVFGVRLKTCLQSKYLQTLLINTAFVRPALAYILEIIFKLSQGKFKLNITL